MGRLVAATRLLDEGDIVEAFVRHTAAFVAHHVILDNGSGDDTLAILRALSAEGLPLTVLQSRSIAFDEVGMNTALYREAAGPQRAGWVIHLDADEFIDDRRAPGGLAGVLAEVARDRRGIGAVEIPMTNYQPGTADDDRQTIWPLRMRRHGPASPTCKIAVRGDLDDVEIGPGNHIATAGGVVVPSLRETRLTLAHYHERAKAQLVAKSVRGWAKVLAAGGEAVREKRSYHYEWVFAALRDDPESLRTREWLTRSGDEGELVDDPVDYRGGSLRYTAPLEPELRTVRALARYLELLATRHGELLDASPEARRLSERWDRNVVRLV